jgi:hypothetical protein
MRAAESAAHLSTQSRAGFGATAMKPEPTPAKRKKRARQTDRWQPSSPLPSPVNLYRNYPAPSFHLSSAAAADSGRFLFNTAQYPNVTLLRIGLARICVLLPILGRLTEQLVYFLARNTRFTAARIGVARASCGIDPR